MDAPVNRFQLIHILAEQKRQEERARQAIHVAQIGATPDTGIPGARVSQQELLKMPVGKPAPSPLEKGISFSRVTQGQLQAMKPAAELHQ